MNWLFIVTPIMGFCICSMFCCTLLYVHSSFAIILMGKRELLPDHTHLLFLRLFITNGIVNSKIYDKRDDFYFEIFVVFPFLGGDVPRSPSYGIYMSQLIRFARVCSNVDDFNKRNLILTAKLLKQGRPAFESR